MRATERGVGAARLADWGRDSGREHWVHAAAFQEQYEGVTAFSTAGQHDRPSLTTVAPAARSRLATFSARCSDASRPEVRTSRAPSAKPAARSPRTLTRVRACSAVRCTVLT